MSASGTFSFSLAILLTVSKSEMSTLKMAVLPLELLMLWTETFLYQHEKLQWPPSLLTVPALRMHSYTWLFLLSVLPV